jgi:hypothetical protein
MTREDMYILGCLFAMNRLMERGSVAFKVKVNGKWEMVPWAEVKEWIEKQTGIMQKTESEGM